MGLRSTQYRHRSATVRRSSRRRARRSGPAVAPESRSSLQLSLGNAKVRATIADYVKALKPLIARAPDALGFAFAVNGQLNSTDLYPSHGLFVKLWPKLLEAAATEAIAEKRREAAAAPPSNEAVAAFIAAAEGAKSGERNINAHTRLGTGETEKSYYFETRRADGAWVHRNYLAR